MARLVIDGYGQLELNQVAWPRDGRIEAQCALDPNDFNDGTTGNTKPFCENGMILVVDNVTRTIKLPTADDAEGTIYAINYSSEHLYDERAQGLKNFKLHAQPATAQKVGAGKAGRIWPGYDFFPRLGYMSIGDKFTTNCIELGDFEDEEAIKTAFSTEGTKIYGVPSETGAIGLVSNTAEGFSLDSPVALQVIKITTMPDGQFALKFQVVKA